MTTSDPLPAFLINHRIVVNISEPWSFVESTGLSKLDGRIVQIGQLPKGPDQRWMAHQWAIMEVESFLSKEGTTVNYLTAFARHERHEVLDELRTQGRATANLTYSLEGGAFPPEDVVIFADRYLKGERAPRGGDLIGRINLV